MAGDIKFVIEDKVGTISCGNRKMNKGFLIWNLPSGKTCPGCTEFCNKRCYAKKAERCYPAVLPCRERNLDACQEQGWEDAFIERVKIYQASSKAFKNRVRIHESGDFFSQEYLDSFKRIARELPDIRFLAFTKSFDLDFSNTPDNLQIVMSIMPDTKAKPPSEFSKAYAGDCDGMDLAKTVECTGLCDTCGMCWDLKRMGINVHFEIH